VGRCFSQYDLGDSEIAINAVCRRKSRCTYRDLAHAQHNIGDEFPAGYTVEFVKECRLEERELVQPDTVVDQEIELLIANLVGPGIRCDGFPDDGDPVPAQAAFEQFGFETKATSQPFEDAGERIDGTKSAHGGIITKTAVAISSRFSGTLIRSLPGCSEWKADSDLPLEVKV
jgi:hypothetical protein